MAKESSILKNIYKTFTEFNDSGFGNKASTNDKRLLNKNGSYNVIKTGIPFWKNFSLYHYLVNTSWLLFLTIIIGSYLCMNLIFASIYQIIGIEYLGGVQANGVREEFMETFFFSAQTLTTIGYGRINPIGITTNIVASMEGMIGVLGFAVATGLLYGRFSRPLTQIIFSKNALLSPYREGKALMFRLANSKNNHLTDLEIKVMTAILVEENGIPVRRYYNLDLERKNVTFLPSVWTVVHPIDDKSPLSGLSKEDIKTADIEILILLKAFDDTSSQQIQVKTSYSYEELDCNAKFDSMMTIDKNGNHMVNLGMIDNFTSL
jgi:inward rectifier potassium channel